MIDSKDFLKNSLIFQMSLGSKELFHSNVWAWLMDRDKEIIKIFFNATNYKEMYENGKTITKIDFDGSTYNILKIDREYKHRDIIIWLQKDGFTAEKEEKYYFVIENKIKSLPTYNQLKEYTKDLDHNKLLGATFTGIINPFNEDIQFSNIIWRFINYNDIANKIEEIVQKSTRFSPDEKQQIIEYCHVIFHINKILNEQLKKSENKLSYDCIGLDDLRIKDLFVKLKGATFIDYLKKHENEFPKIAGYTLHIGQSFHNGKATLDVWYTNWKDDSNPWLVLGVQLEGSQYRKVAERGCLKIDKPHEYIFNEFENIGWFDKTFDKYLNRTVFGKKTTMACRHSEKFNKYTGDNYSFVYQYYDITDEGNDYNELFLSIKKDILEAKSILENII